MRVQVWAATAALLSGISQAHAADQPPTLPTFAVAAEQTPSLWSGLRIGTEIFGVSGSKAFKGGVGAAVNVGYDRVLENNVLLGVKASTGFAPAGAVGFYQPFGRRIRGFDFATADVKVGYDMGRLTPYLIGGVALARPTYDGGLGSFASGGSIDNLISGRADLEASGRVGAGVEYAITDRLSVGLEVSVARGRGSLYPYW